MPRVIPSQLFNLIGEVFRRAKQKIKKSRVGKMDYNRILPELFLGSYPKDNSELDLLRQRSGITAVLNLQTDEDMRSLNLDWGSLQAHYRASGIELRRVPVRDFDPTDLREKLPECVRVLDQLLTAGRLVYVHCTAGAGRSPTVVIAHLHWCRDWDLDEAVAYVKKCRMCSPNIETIRQTNLSS